jgi:hypothetical protein
VTIWFGAAVSGPLTKVIGVLTGRGEARGGVGLGLGEGDLLGDGLGPNIGVGIGEASVGVGDDPPRATPGLPWGWLDDEGAAAPAATSIASATIDQAAPATSLLDERKTGIRFRELRTLNATTTVPALSRPRIPSEGFQGNWTIQTAMTR